jgi:cyclopropane-fatty-acyl-phospholipid synthase
MLFLESRFEHAVSRIGKNAVIPLRLELWNGRRFDLSPNPTVTIAIPEPSALRYFISPDLNTLGEAFVEGRISVKGSIHEVFKVAEKLARFVTKSAGRGVYRFGRHTRAHDLKAIEYHYDVSNEFYSLFLDQNMVYSCAYYRNAGDTLEAAQIHKLDHILNKLALRPGERFLDIGCGWGALVRRATEKYGAIATGITLSRNQYEHARARILAEGLQDRCNVELLDYREMPGDGAFDKIASVGMFEHVGLKNLPVYFGKLRTLLKDDGLVLNHGITTSSADNRWMGLGAGEFIDRYVFPGGELPHLSLLSKEMALAGLEIADVESLRRHYAHTCREWASRLELNKERAQLIAGEKRARIWQIYLAGCAYGFANSWMNIYQVLAHKSCNTEMRALPLTREYVYSNQTGG